MCFGGGDNGAAFAAQQQQQKIDAQEAQRQADIKTGQTNIDTAFSQFDPAYFDKFKQTYTGNYDPQIADQYAQAKDKLTAVLAGRGTLESTPGAAKLAELEKTRADAEGQIGNQAVDAANSLKKNIEDTKTSLYNTNIAAADPESIMTRATAEAGSIAAPQALSPLGQVFANVLQPLAIYNKSDATSLNPRLPWNTNGAAPLSGRGSSIYG